MASKEWGSQWQSTVLSALGATAYKEEIHYFYYASCMMW
jgi:hypothetical protein